MTRIAKISLDIRKDNIIDNDPIILRQGDSDVIIEASISNNGYPDVEIEFATFVAKKPDGTIISNDPVNISGNVISYPISKHLTDSVGKIQDAYFMINNQITTCGFDISIIPSTQLDDTSVNYIPGLEDINKFLESAEADWLGKIQKMKNEIDGLDIPAEFKLLMDKALSDAKAQYQPTIDAAEDNVENIVADLAAKKLDLTNNSDELNATIATIKAQVVSITSFLDNIQKQIIEANSSFTTGQQAQISQSIADSQKKLADSIASMQSQVAQSISDLKAQTDALTVAKTGPKGDKGDIGPQGPKGDKGDTGSVDNAGLTAAPAFVELQTQVNNSGVRTNLITDSNFSSGLDHWIVLPGSKAEVTTDSDGDTCIHITGTGKVAGIYCQTVPFNQNQVTTGSVLAKGIGTVSFIGLEARPTSNFGTISTDYYSKVGSTMQASSTTNLFVAYFNPFNGVVDVYVKFAKLEKGSIATDWCPNPSEILTQSDYAKIKAAIVALGGSLS